MLTILVLKATEAHIAFQKKPYISAFAGMTEQFENTPQV